MGHTHRSAHYRVCGRQGFVLVREPDKFGVEYGGPRTHTGDLTRLDPPLLERCAYCAFVASGRSGAPGFALYESFGLTTKQVAV